jgi:DNA-binding CsgD family transcriptional regulator
MAHQALSIHALREPSHLGSLIDAIGEQDFESELLWLLHGVCGADHCAIFGLDGAAPTEVAAATLGETQTVLAKPGLYLAAERWRRDPSMIAAHQRRSETSASLMRLDIPRLEDAELRDLVYTSIGDRLLLFGRTVAGHVALSILKSGDGNLFGRGDILKLSELATVLLPIVGKHAGAVLHRRRTSLALATLGEIEDCILTTRECLPPRESQVCARIIYGMSSMGIALELGIGEETVMTYRKRIYQRLGIATQRELLLWYVAEWHKPPPPAARRLTATHAP